MVSVDGNSQGTTVGENYGRVVHRAQWKQDKKQQQQQRRPPIPSQGWGLSCCRCLRPLMPTHTFSMKVHTTHILGQPSTLTHRGLTCCSSAGSASTSPKASAISRTKVAMCATRPSSSSGKETDTS